MKNVRELSGLKNLSKIIIDDNPSFKEPLKKYIPIGNSNLKNIVDYIENFNKNFLFSAVDYVVSDYLYDLSINSKMLKLFNKNDSLYNSLFYFSRNRLSNYSTMALEHDFKFNGGLKHMLFPSIVHMRALGAILEESSNDSCIETLKEGFVKGLYHLSQRGDFTLSKSDAIRLNKLLPNGYAPSLDLSFENINYVDALAQANKIKHIFDSISGDFVDANSSPSVRHLPVVETNTGNNSYVDNNYSFSSDNLKNFYSNLFEVYNDPRELIDIFMKK